jgi:putative ABC transport system permease protein
MNAVTFAIRQLRRSPGFTATAAVTLALGVGANTTMFSVVNAVLLRPLPYDSPGQLVQVWEAPDTGRRNSVSVGVFDDWRRESRSFEGLAAFTPTDLNLTGAGIPERIKGMRMSASGLQVLRARPRLGRTFAADEDQAGRDKVVVLTEGLWRRRFGGDDAIVGRAIHLGGEPHVVVGVLPAFALPVEGAEFVVPFVVPREPSRSNHFLRVVGRLQPGVTLQQAQAELATVSDRFRALYPVFKRDWSVSVVSLHEQVTGDIRPTLTVLLGAVGLVLLIACANVANLLLARASVRAREIAIRLAIGASRARIVRQLLVESLVLAVLGTVLGVALAYVGVALLRQAAPTGLPRIQEVGVDLRVLAFAALVSVATGLLFGLAPALQTSRPDLGGTLKEGSRGLAGGRSRVRSTLAAAEVALALVLLAGAGLLVNSFVRLIHVDPGFDPRGALAFQMSLPDSKYPDAARRSAVTASVLERIAVLPGVGAVGAATSLPLGGSLSDTLIQVEGDPAPPVGGRNADFAYCTPDYFRAMGITLLRGRVFDERDTASGPHVVVVNESFARAYLGGDPLGRRITDTQGAWEVVGVVGDVRARSLDRDMRPALYWPHAFQRFNTVHVVLRTEMPPARLAESIRTAVLQVDPEQPIANLRALDGVIAGSVAQRRFVLGLLAGFAAAALILAAVGLYGVISYGVAQRRREIGIRIAVGATQGAVVRLVLRQGTELTVFGILLGVCGSLALTRVLASQLYGVEATDAPTLAAVAAILAGVALFACWVPARRASRVDPVQALR